MVHGLIIRSSAIHAAGCYTTQPIRKGKRVLEYGGRRIPKSQADDLYTNRPVTYLFGLDDSDLVIDGYGTAMYLNHSCDPNCETIDYDGTIWIAAMRNIEPGEELTYEYNLYDSEDEHADCHCGAKNCRGTMFSEDEVKRRARAAKRKARSSAQAT